MKPGDIVRKASGADYLTDADYKIVDIMGNAATVQNQKNLNVVHGVPLKDLVEKKA